MKVALDSDFTDYYDEGFGALYEPHRLTYRRRFSEGPTRQEMFPLLSALGYRTPRHGKVAELAGLPKPPETVVVYLDEGAREGKGLLRLPLESAIASYPEHYASEYIEALQFLPGKSSTVRLMLLGHRQFWLRYSSNDAWRSNCGKVDIELMHEETRGPAPALQQSAEPCNAIYDLLALRKNVYDVPLYAIDFVLATDGAWAVDFNTAPRLQDTGLEARLSPETIYQEITAWLKNHAGQQAVLP